MSETKILILDVEPEVSLWLQSQIQELGIRSEMHPYQEDHLIEDVEGSNANIVLISGDHADNPAIALSMINLHNLGIPAFHCSDLHQAEAVISLLLQDTSNRYLLGRNITIDPGSDKAWRTPITVPSEFYRALVEDMPILVSRTSRSGMLTYVNQHFCDFFGSSPSELIGRDYFSLFPEEERARLAAHFASFSRENPVRTFEVPVVDTHGIIHWQRWMERAIYDADGNNIGYQSIGEDFSDRKEMEDSLRASEAKFRAAVDNMAQGFVLFSEVRNEKGEVVDFLVEFSNILQQTYFPMEIVGKKASDLIPFFFPGIDLLTKAIQSHTSGNALVIDRYDMPEDIRAQFRLQSVEFRISSFGDRLVFIWRDISEKVRMEEELRKTRDDLASLINSSSQMLTMYDLSTLLKLVKEQIGRMVPFDNVGIYLIEKDEPQVAAYHTYYRYPETEAHAITAFKNVVFPYLKQGEINKNYLAVDDTYKPNAVVDQLKQAIGKESHFFIQNRSLLFIPLVFQSEITGLITLVHHLPNIYPENHCILMRAFANTVALAVANSQLHQSAQNQAVMMERLRLARELHDSVTQSLYSINLYTDAARVALEAGRTEKVSEYLAELHKMALASTRELRLLIYELRPPELDELGLEGAVRSRLDAVERRCELEAHLKTENLGVISRKLEGEIYQVIQEALNNVIKHAAAKRVEVILRGEDTNIILEIHDDGVGFNTRKNRSGMGLKAIREQVELLGGEFSITSAKNKGTMLKIEVPR